MGIRENVEAAAMADLVFEDLLKNTIARSEPMIDRFWERMIELCRQRLPNECESVEPRSNKPMSENEAIAFERLELEWGKHKGTEIGRVETEYLVFLVEGDRLKEKLQRYVRSERFRKRQKEDN